MRPAIPRPLTIALVLLVGPLGISLGAPGMTAAIPPHSGPSPLLAQGHSSPFDAPLLGGSWPTYLQNPERTGANLLERTLAPSNASQLATLWKIKTNGSDFGSPTVVNGTVYAGSWDGYEYALRAATGHIVWKKYLGTDPNCSWGNPMGVAGNAAVWNGTVFVGGGDDYWYALNAANGSVEWRVKVTDTTSSGGGYNWASPLLYRGFAYIGLASCIDSPLVRGAVLMVNLTGNHSTVHTFYVVPSGQLGGTVWTTPAVDPAANRIWVATGNDDGLHTQKYAESIVALNASNLSVVGSWQVPGVFATDSDFGSGPTLFNDSTGRPLVGATNKNGVFYALNRSNVSSNGSWKPVWQLTTGGGFSPAAFDGRVLYAAGGSVTIGGMTYGGSVRAVTPKNGSVIWTAGASDYIYGGLAYANGLVVDGGGLYLQVLNASSGKELKSLLTPGSTYIDGAASIAQGRIFWESGDDSTTGYFLASGILMAASANVTPASGSAPLTSTFRGAPTGGMPPYNFTWSFGDGHFGYGSPVTHRFASPGIYNASGWINDSSNLSKVVNLTVAVTSPLTAQLTSGARLGPAPLNVSFVASAQNGTAPYTFSWNFSDGTANASGASVRHEFVRPGQFLVHLTARDAGGRSANASALVVVTTPFSMRLLAVPTSGIAPLTVNFTAVGFNGSAPYRYDWAFGDGSMDANGPTAQHLYPVGIFTATLRGNDQAGASRIATATIDVAQAPTPLSASFEIVGVIGACPTAPGSAKFAGNATGGTPPYAYSWNFGDGTAPMSGTPADHSYASAGNYTVTLTARDAGGQFVNSSQGIQIPRGICLPNGPGPQPNSPPATSGLWLVVAGTGAVVAVVAAIAAVLLVRRRRRS